MLPLAQGLRDLRRGRRPRGGRRLGTLVERPGGRRRRRRPAHGALRPALGPLPRVVVPPGLARLPARPRRPARADRRGCPLVLDVVLDRPAVLTPLLPCRGGGRRQLRQRATTRCSTPSPGTIAPVGPPALRPAALDGPGPGHGEDVPGLRRPAVSPSATGWASDVLTRYQVWARSVRCCPLVAGLVRRVREESQLVAGHAAEWRRRSPPPWPRGRRRARPPGRRRQVLVQQRDPTTDAARGSAAVTDGRTCRSGACW